MLGAELQKYNCKVYHDSADADYLVVKKAIDTAESMDTILVGDDTDLLVLLIFHTQPQGKDIFFVPEPKKKYKSSWMEYKGDEEKLGPILCKHILFMHAFLGCDTTSRIYGFGKSAMMKKIKSDKSLMQAAEVFLSLHSSSAEIQKAGEQAMTILYNGNPDESLNGL